MHMSSWWGFMGALAPGLGFAAGILIGARGAGWLKPRRSKKSRLIDGLCRGHHSLKTQEELAEIRERNRGGSA